MHPDQFSRVRLCLIAGPGKFSGTQISWPSASIVQTCLISSSTHNLVDRKLGTVKPMETTEFANLTRQNNHVTNCAKIKTADRCQTNQVANRIGGKTLLSSGAFCISRCWLNVEQEKSEKGEWLPDRVEQSLGLNPRRNI